MFSNYLLYFVMFQCSLVVAMVKVMITCEYVYMICNDIYLVIILSRDIRPFNQITGDEPKVVEIHMKGN